jgi:hypothetical protein
MSAILEIENDAGTPITSANFGAVNGGAYQQLKFVLKNIGTDSATSVQLSIAQLAANDGINFVTMATDIAGNPGAFSSAAINVGTLVAAAIFTFWLRVTVPTGATPAGNPRQWDTIATYTGT